MSNYLKVSLLRKEEVDQLLDCDTFFFLTKIEETLEGMKLVLPEWKFKPTSVETKLHTRRKEATATSVDMVLRRLDGRFRLTARVDDEVVIFDCLGYC